MRCVWCQELVSTLVNTEIACDRACLVSYHCGIGGRVGSSTNWVATSWLLQSVCRSMMTPLERESVCVHSGMENGACMNVCNWLKNIALSI